MRESLIALALIATICAASGQESTIPTNPRSIPMPEPPIVSWTDLAEQGEHYAMTPGMEADVFWCYWAAFRLCPDAPVVAHQREELARKVEAAAKMLKMSRDPVSAAELRAIEKVLSCMDLSM